MRSIYTGKNSLPKVLYEYDLDRKFNSKNDDVRIF